MPLVVYDPLAWTRGEGMPLVVYDPLAWTRSEPVQLTPRPSEPHECLSIHNTDGHAVSMQTLAVRQEGGYWQAKSSRGG